MSVRPAAVAGSWYPGTAGALAREVDDYLQPVPPMPPDPLVAIIAPHAGIMFSGPVAAYAYKAAAAGRYDVAVLVGPSHFLGYDGVATAADDAFDSPLGPAPIDHDLTAAILKSPVVRSMPAAHRREHSLEMQLPFLRRLMPDLPILPLLMGYQTRATIYGLAESLTEALARRHALLIASTDLSHYFPASTAMNLDGRVRQFVMAFDPEGLMAYFEEYPEHERGRYVSCGGGPTISVLLAARALGARGARVLKYAHSGEISGDDEAVVGYMAAAIGEFSAPQGGAG